MPGMGILCAVDFSDTSALALASAREIADHYAQPLTIVTVVDPLLAAAEQMQVGRDPVTLIREALGEFVDERIGGGSAAGQHLHVRIGNVGDEVMAAAHKAHAQLLVLGTQGTAGVAKAVFGSVAERLLRTTDLPVLVIPPAFEHSSRHVLGSLREVLVPVDFHDHAVDDARVAARVAASSHARLHLVHVVPGDEMSRWTILRPSVASQIGDGWQQARDAHTGSALAALQRLATALDEQHPPQCTVFEGGPAEEIAAAAAQPEVDLIVMGLRGVSGDFSGRVGSVAYRVLGQAPVPVLALPAESRGAQVLGFLG